MTRENNFNPKTRGLMTFICKLLKHPRCVDTETLVSGNLWDYEFRCFCGKENGSGRTFIC